MDELILKLTDEELLSVHKALIMRSQNVQFQMADKSENNRLTILTKELKTLVEVIEKIENIGYEEETT